MAYEQLKLGNQLCFRLYTVSRLVIQAYRPYLESLGITYPQYLVLMLLWEEDKQPVNSIAHRLFLETNTVTPLIQRMEKQGLVNRQKGTNDGRQTLVSLTQKGRDMEEQAKEIPNCLTECITMRGVQPEMLMPLFTPLDQLINSLGNN